MLKLIYISINSILILIYINCNNKQKTNTNINTNININTNMNTNIKKRINAKTTSFGGVWGGFGEPKWHPKVAQERPK